MNTKLDTTALVHTARMNDKSINAYRISITMDHIIVPEMLQQAVDNIIQRYPMICCRMVEDGYWFYSEGLDSLKVMPDIMGILGSINHKNVYQQAVNIIYSEDKFIFEAFHSVTDGHGAFTFINALLGEYMRLNGNPHPEFIYHGLPSEGEFEDSFVKFGDADSFPEKLVKVSNAFAFEKKDSSVPVSFTTFRLNIRQMKALAKSYRCTLNELLLVMVYNTIFTFDSSAGKDVVIAVPINLRNKFRSNSLRNFFHLAKIVLRKQQKEDYVQEMIKEIRYQLHLQNNRDYLHRAITWMARLQTSFIMKISPLWLKNIMINTGDRLGYDKSCMTVSNLGDLSYMLPSVAENIRFIDIMLSPRANSRYNCCISSIGDYMNVTFTHSHANDSFVSGIAGWLDENSISYTTQLHA